MNKVNSDIEKKSYVGSKQACVGEGDRERQRKRQRYRKSKRERHRGRERTFVRLGWEGLCKEGTGTGEPGTWTVKRKQSYEDPGEEHFKQNSEWGGHETVQPDGGPESSPVWLGPGEYGIQRKETKVESRQDHWASLKSSERAGLSSWVLGSHQRVLCKGIVTSLTLWTGHSGSLR